MSLVESMSSYAHALASQGALDTARFPSDVRLALRLLARMKHGRLDVTFPDGQRAHFGDLRIAERADLRLANWNLVRAALKSGDIGFAESYIAGDWDTNDLVRLLEFFIVNRDAAESLIYGSVIGRLAYRVRHLLNRNTRAQAKKNIHAHYDLGNDFYRLWLDRTMTYSSALFERAAPAHEVATAEELERGQHAKYARVLQELQLTPGARLLEIGCGWGGLAEAAARAQLQVTGLTLSTEQLAYARARLVQAGLAGDLHLRDYRDEAGQYDGIASIEMFEAVGEAFWPSYFATLRRCLKPGGRACLQTIVIADHLFERYRTGTDFIQQYIFPGGMLPSRSAFRERAGAAGLEVVSEHRFGADYARTLATWRAWFHARLEDVRTLGFDDRFVRIWDFYLAYCEAAFARENTDVVQYTLLAR
jgi:cyclopropane-fatty-acyl-phospholipid synthase